MLVLSIGLMATGFCMLLAYSVLARVVFVVYLVYAAFNYSGYCWEQKRWLSDEELFISAIRHESSRNKMMVDDSDESVRKFLKENPECCYSRITGIGEIDTLSKVFGSIYKYVVVEYELNDDARTEGGKYNYGEVHIGFNSCGKIIDNFGTTFERKYSRYKHK